MKYNVNTNTEYLLYTIIYVGSDAYVFYIYKYVKLSQNNLNLIWDFI